MNSPQEWLEQLVIASEDPDEVRRARLFIGVCMGFGFCALFGLLLVPLTPGLSMRLGVVGLIAAAVSGYVIAIRLSMSGHVDASALLVGVNLSAAIVSFNVFMGKGTHDIIWLLAFNMIVVGTGLRASRIWVYWLVNVILYVATFAYAPGHYFGAEDSPARGPFLLIVLTAMALGIYIIVSSHEKSFARTCKAAALAIEAQHDAQESSKIKSLFLANMSHELRTPLNAITGYSELIREQLEDADMDRAAMLQDLDYVEQSSRHLLELINDVLDLSKIESGKMEFEFATFDVCTLIQDVTALLQPMVLRTRNTLELHVPPQCMIRSDEMRVRQILFNLLSNALKFTKEGQILIEVRQDESLEDMFITVKDTGIGMSAEHLSHIFHAFTQADTSTTRRYGGTGLGLTLCRTFARLLGGDILVESEEGVGSSFTLILPLGEGSLAR